MNHIYSYGYTRTRDFYKLDNNHDKKKEDEKEIWEKVHGKKGK